MERAAVEHAADRVAFRAVALNAIVQYAIAEGINGSSIRRCSSHQLPSEQSICP
jgi:hypothetical protein